MQPQPCEILPEVPKWWRESQQQEVERRVKEAAEYDAIISAGKTTVTESTCELTQK